MDQVNFVNRRHLALTSSRGGLWAAAAAAGAGAGAEAAEPAGPPARRSVAVETVLTDSLETVARRERLLQLEEDILEQLLFLLPHSLSARLYNGG